MKITAVDIYPVNIPMRYSGNMAVGSWHTCEFVVTAVHTDEGITGWGEVPPWMPVSRESQGTIVAVIRDFLAAAILDENPYNIEKIWDAMDRAAPANPMAKTPLDISLYDLISRHLKIPLSSLLGGRVVDRIPLAGIVPFGTADEAVNLAGIWVSQGYNTVRLKIGMGPKDDLAVVKAVREAYGDNLKIRVDANQAYTPAEAVRVIRMLEPYDLEFAEQPTAWHDFEGNALVAASVNTPVMLHESLYTAYDAAAIIRRRAASVIGLKLDRPGGITGARKVAAMAELCNVPIFVCSSVELGISTAASMQLASSLYRNIGFACEASGPLVITDDIVKEQVHIDNGCCLVPKEIGIGVEIDLEKLKHYSADVVHIGSGK